MGKSKSKRIIVNDEIATYLDKVAEFVNENKCAFSSYSDKIIDTVINLGFICPCRIGNVPCPCEFAADELVNTGKCHCGLFVRK